MFFEQVIGDGASIFLSILAVIIGFGVAMGYTDFMKTREEDKRDH
jgi:hypothetical protein